MTYREAAIRAVAEQWRIHHSQHGTASLGTWLPAMSRCVDPWCVESIRVASLPWAQEAAEAMRKMP